VYTYETFLSWVEEGVSRIKATKTDFSNYALTYTRNIEYLSMDGVRCEHFIRTMMENFWEKIWIEGLGDFTIAE
jgi:hypothetical protein